jgi:hypothetical protein
MYSYNLGRLGCSHVLASPPNEVFRFEMFSISTSISILIIFSQTAIALPRGQEILAFTPTSAPQIKVPGHNHAYFTQVSAEDQLFWIRDLAIYPDPPKLYVILVVENLSLLKNTLSVSNYAVQLTLAP